MNKFQNKYKVKSARLPEYDYSTVGYYCITICTQNKKCYFGRIIGHEVQLSEIGKIARQCWVDIPIHFPHVSLDTFIIMPNHVHGIICINNVETQNFASLQITKNVFGPQSKNLASIVRGYKIGVQKLATVNNIPFSWQPRFYDHVIRNKKSLQNIRQYIASNVEKWLMDEMYATE
jgi:REP element-mobilizing transposase RayT